MPKLEESTPTGEAPKRIRVAMVDDHTMMRDGIRVFIESLPDFDCAWMAETASDAVTKLQNDPPDVLIVDITLPDRHGIEFVKDAHALYPALPVLILSMHDERVYGQRALKAGAKGYLMKSAPHDVFEKALRRVAAGGFWLNQEVADEILAAFSSGVSRRSDESLDILSDRELQVFQLLGDGKGSAEIADALHISAKTVDVHRMNIRSKLHLPDGSALIRFAIRWVETRRMGHKEH